VELQRAKNRDVVIGAWVFAALLALAAVPRLDKVVARLTSEASLLFAWVGDRLEQPASRGDMLIALACTWLLLSGRSSTPKS
jgi:hypothetical protein